MRLSPVIVGGLIFTWWIQALTTAPARADGLQNLTAAWSLARSGAFTTRENGPADMFREPLPVFADAVAIKVIEAQAGPAPLADWTRGWRVRAVKAVNLVWMLLLCGAVWGSARTLGASRIAAWAALLLVNGAGFALRSAFVDSLGTDLAGAALLTTASGLLAAGWKTGRWRWWIGAGLAFGLAILVKASLLYVIIGLAIVLALLAAWRAKGWPGDNRGVAIILLLLAAAAVITPWSNRNQRLFGTRALTDRGGEVLLLRAYEDQVTPTEYSGAWCAFAPGRLQGPVCKLTGWSKADLKPGGALGRFSRAAPPDPEAIRKAAQIGGGTPPGLSFYHTAKARYQALPAPADARAKQEATALIAAEPGRHLAMIPAYLWRGLGGLTVWLGLVGLIALLRKRDDLAVFLIPAVGLGLFLAVFSHFIPRYAWPMIPMTCVVLPLILETARRRAPAA